MKLKGTAIIREIDSATGKILSEEIVDNLTVGDGLERVARLLGSNVDYFPYVAIGTGTTSATTGDTALETEFTREAASWSYEASYKSVFEKTFTVGSGISENITEMGLTDSATVSGSVLLDRFVFSPKTLSAASSFYVKITITVS